MVERLWSEDEELTFDGRFWKTKKAFVAPKPVNGRCILVSAASSGAGFAYATRHSDLIFITSPAHNAQIKAAARENGREVRTIINPHQGLRMRSRSAFAQRSVATPPGA